VLVEYLNGQDALSLLNTSINYFGAIKHETIRYLYDFRPTSIFQNILSSVETLAVMIINLEVAFSKTKNFGTAILRK
jgi:hypothetical protein